jgi:hypothetical protein
VCDSNNFTNVAFGLLVFAPGQMAVGGPQQGLGPQARRFWIFHPGEMIQRRQIFFEVEMTFAQPKPRRDNQVGVFGATVVVNKFFKLRGGFRPALLEEIGFGFDVLGGGRLSNGAGTG